jgi:prepilin-type N-terminal cleavage/methylation domain-containing protein
MNRRQSGYSLVEILVVVGIIGIISLVSVPNFINMQRAGKLKTSLRNFVSDIRTMRQRAVTRHEQTKITFTTGTAATARSYTMWEKPVSTWIQVGGGKVLEEACYFESQTNFGAGATGDIIFKNDGTPVLPANQFSGIAVLKTDWNLPRTAGQTTAGQYTVTVTFSGSVKTN